MQDTHDAFGPAFDPPYDSPIEELLAQNALKYLAEDCRFQKQVEVPTNWGTFRLDFLIERRGQRIGVECDGRDFHDEYRDEWRDALILGTGAVDVMYRLRGCDLVYHIEDILFLMSGADPMLFSERGQINLAKLASVEARGWQGDSLCPSCVVAYQPTPGEMATGNLRHIYIRRWTRLVSVGHRALWWDWWKYARQFGTGCRTVEDLIATQEVWIKDRDEGKVSGEWRCEDCGNSIDRWGVKAVWEQRVVCRDCYTSHVGDQPTRLPA